MVTDYYAILGVDRRADRATIAGALDRCRHLWSSGTRNPKHKHAYQSYLDQIPEIRRSLLGEPSARVAYDADLESDARRARGAALDALQRFVRLRSARGYLTATDRGRLEERAGALGLTGADLAPMIEAIPIRGDEPRPTTAGTPAETLDPVTLRQIRAALDLVGLPDLYRALGLRPDVDASEIVLRADEERRRWMRKSQVTAEKTAWLEVISYVQSHLTNPDGRARYDRSLVAQAEDDLSRLVAFAVEGLVRIDPGTAATLVDEGASLGITPARSMQILAATCRDVGVIPPGDTVTNLPDPGRLPRLVRCPSCGRLNDAPRPGSDPSGSSCRTCGVSLAWTCPVCRTTRGVADPRCACGFEQNDLEPVLRHFEASQQAFRMFDDDAALSHLKRVLELAPRLVGARKAVEKVRARMREADAAGSEFQLERARGRLFAARETLHRWEELVGPTSPPLLAAEAALVADLRRAFEALARGRSLGVGDPIRARAAYREALAIATDLDEAREELERLPPDPPTSLRASIEADGIALSWTPPAPDGLGVCQYRLMRKAGAVPSHAQDGVAVAETDGVSAVDRGAAGGVAMGYAVFSLRRGLASTGVSLAPFVVLRDVADLRSEGDGGRIVLSWALPPGAAGARVVRVATSGGTDSEVEALPDRAIDRGLEDGRIYRYRVAALYRDEGGRTLASAGVEIAATTSPPAAAPGPLSLRADTDGAIVVGWPAAGGTVRILRTVEPPALAAGVRIGAGEVSRLAGDWLPIGRADSTRDPEPPSSGAAYYTPFLFQNGWAIPGTPLGHAGIPDPTDLRVVRAGEAGRLHLRWRWWPRATGAVVAARLGKPPTGPADAESSILRISDVEYGRQGFFSMTLPMESAGSGPWHLAVFSLAEADGIEAVSPGLDPSARTVVPGPNPDITVSYELRRPLFPGRPWVLALQTDPPGSQIPPLSLVTHPRTVPLSADDGDIVARFPAARDGASFPIRSRVDLAKQRSRLFADPSADPADLPPIRFRHPESAGTRV